MAKPINLTVAEINRINDAVVATVAGSSTFTGDAATVAFVVTHGAGFTPSQVVISPTTAAAAAAAYVSAKTSTTFTITFSAAPASAADNVKFDWIVKA